MEDFGEIGYLRCVPENVEKRFYRELNRKFLEMETFRKIDFFKCVFVCFQQLAQKLNKIELNK